MRVVFFAVLLFAGVLAYDINAIQKALSVNYDIEQGSFSLFNVTNCEFSPTCFGNNPESPYVEYNFPSWNSSFGRLQADQAIFVIHARPPPCRYFGFTPYIFTRQAILLPRLLFASLSDTLNMNVVNISEDGTIAIISSPNYQVTNDIQSTLEPFLEENSINALPLPGQLLNLGLGARADTFGYLSRYALFDNSTQGLEYLHNIPGYLFKLTPKTSDTTSLYPYPTYRPYGPLTKNESYLQPALAQLIGAVQAAETGVPLVEQGIDAEHLVGYVNGFTCINASLDCSGDNRDARYIGSRGGYVYNTTDSHTWVIGVQHQTTGKAVYTAVAATYQDKQLGVLSVADTKMKGSAEQFIPTNIYAPNLYAIKFARSCNSNEPFCFVIPVNFPGAPLNATIGFTERVQRGTGLWVSPSTCFPQISQRSP